MNTLLKIRRQERLLELGVGVGEMSWQKLSDFTHHMRKGGREEGKEGEMEGERERDS